MKMTVSSCLLVLAMHLQGLARVQNCSLTAGPIGGSTTGVSGAGVSWSNTAKLTASDGNYASASQHFGSIFGGTATSQYITLTNFGFSIPTGSTICGIKVEIQRNATGFVALGDVSDNSIRIIKGGAIGTTEMSTGTAWTSSNAYTSFGGNGNGWGLSWLPSDVNASNFGVAVSVAFSSLVSVTLQANIDYIRITIYYDIAPLALYIQDLSGSAQGSGDLLSFNCPSDLPTHCRIQRSPNSVVWQDLASVDPVADGHYQWLDPAPLAGDNYYRVLLADGQGQLHYSSILEINRADRAGIGLHCYPNPAEGFTRLSSNTPIDKVFIESPDGRIVRTLAPPGAAHELDIPLEGLVPGLYVLVAGKTAIRLVKR